MASASEEIERVYKEYVEASLVILNIIYQDAPAIVAQEYQKEFQLALFEEHSPNGEPYAALKAKSKYPKKKKRDPRNKILDDTGQMKRGVKSEVSRGKADIYWEYTDPRGREPQVYHQFGTRKMIARPLATLSDTAAVKIEERLTAKAKSRMGNNPISNLLIYAIVDRNEYGE